MGTCNLIIAIMVFVSAYFVFGMISTLLSYEGLPSLFLVYAIAFACAIGVYYSKQHTCTDGGGGGYEYDGRSTTPTRQ